jgi:hypothetical protein
LTGKPENCCWVPWPGGYSLQLCTRRAQPSKLCFVTQNLEYTFGLPFEIPTVERITIMKKLLFLLLLIGPTLMWAQSPFDGTWKIDYSKAKFPKKPDEYLLKDGDQD